MAYYAPSRTPFTWANNLEKRSSCKTVKISAPSVIDFEVRRCDHHKDVLSNEFQYLSSFTNVNLQRMEKTMHGIAAVYLNWRTKQNYF